MNKSEQAPINLAALVGDALDKLVANGGGTVRGIADELHRQGVTGRAGKAHTCVIANYLCDSTPETLDRVLTVLPVSETISCSCCAEPLPRVEVTGGVVLLPPVLNELALAFDRHELPELEC